MARFREFWVSYISDQAAAGERKHGLDVAFVRDKLTEAGFVAHRRHVEQERPLEEDLLSLRIDILPDYLRRWRNAKARGIPTVALPFMVACALQRHGVELCPWGGLEAGSEAIQ